MTRPEVRDALDRFAAGDPNVRIVMPDVIATDETGQYPIGVGVEATGEQVGNAPISATAVILADPEDLLPDDDQEDRHHD